MQGFRFGSVERPLIVTCSGGAVIRSQELESRSQEVVGVSAKREWAKRRNRRVGETASSVGAISKLGTAAR
jgi:hypothetical protein